MMLRDVDVLYDLPALRQGEAWITLSERTLDEIDERGGGRLSYLRNYRVKHTHPSCVHFKQPIPSRFIGVIPAKNANAFRSCTNCERLHRSVPRKTLPFIMVVPCGDEWQVTLVEQYGRGRIIHVGGAFRALSLAHRAAVKLHRCTVFVQGERGAIIGVHEYPDNIEYSYRLVP